MNADVVDATTDPIEMCVDCALLKFKRCVCELDEATLRRWFLLEEPPIFADPELAAITRLQVEQAEHSTGLPAGADRGPCSWVSDSGIRRCFGTALYPPKGWTGRAIVRCDGYEPHELAVSDRPSDHTDPFDVIAMTEAERRLLTELLLDDDREAGLL